jgi:hypothetical protein
MIYDELVASSVKKVLIIDDREDEIHSIKEALNAKEISNEYLKVDVFEQTNKQLPIEGVELVILDLHYNELAAIDPELCADQVGKGVSEGQPYYLVGWTKDPEQVEDVVDILRSRNLPPIAFTSMRKETYREGEMKYNTDRLFADIKTELKKVETVQEFIGRIIDIEENSVLINCIILDDPEVFEVRRFDLLPFENYISLALGTIIKIKVTTKPGSRIFEFITDDAAKSKLFIKPDDFDDLEDLSFLKA